jgi:hypothetical protein
MIRAAVPSRPSVIPDDAALVELRAEHLVFRSRQRVKPGTTLDFSLVMEGRPWPLQAPVVTCAVRKERGVPLYEMRVSLEPLAVGDRHLIALFIEKGRGAPGLAPRARR